VAEMQKLRKPRKECGGALRGLDAHPVPETADVRGRAAASCLPERGFVRRRLAALGSRHMGPMSSTVALSASFGFFIFFLIIIKHFCL